MARVIVFDVNETLLDLAALDPAFARIFGDAAARREWFTQVLQSALTATVTAAYSDFGAVGMAALAMTAARRGTAPGPSRGAREPRAPTRWWFAASGAHQLHRRGRRGAARERRVARLLRARTVRRYRAVPQARTRTLSDGCGTPRCAGR